MAVNRNARGTKRGYVYFATAGDMDEVKIGFTTNIASRLSTLGTGNSRKITLLNYFASFVEAEALVQQRFSASRIRNEWFELDEDMEEFWDDILDYQIGRAPADGNLEDVFIGLRAMRIILDTIGEPWPAAFVAEVRGDSVGGCS